ncbi:MAG TPA: Wzz/FepE/Etk N-terminal domain-containing protein [Terriglobia bacterium]|nr:Wzz/FepE/Etk N-terminal domain-containing protein [Terriglobia bacterium]
MMDYEADRNLTRRMVRLRRHWRWILAGSALCSLAVFIVSLTLPKIYRATTHVLVSESKIGTATENTLWQYALIQTYVPFVNSDSLIQNALHDLHLDQPPYSLTVYRFRKKGYLDVSIPKHSRLLEINVEFPNAKIAAALANDLAQQAAAFNDRLMASDTVSTQRFLKQSLDQARDALKQAQAGRLQVREKAKIEGQEKELSILLDGKAGVSTQLQKLSMALSQNQARAKALSEQLRKEPRIVNLQKSVISDPFLERAVDQSGKGHDPRLSVTEQTLSQNHVEFQKEYVSALADVQAERAGIEAGRARLGGINRALNHLLGGVAKSRNDIEIADRKFAMAQKAFVTASQDYLNASISVSSKSQDLKQLAPATVPEQPVRPKILLNTFLAGILALLVLAAAAAIMDGFREAAAVRRDSVDEPAEAMAHR